MDEDEEIITIPLIIPNKKEDNGIPLIIPVKKKSNQQVSGQSKTTVSPLKNGGQLDPVFSPVDMFLGGGTDESKLQGIGLPVMNKNEVFVSDDDSRLPTTEESERLISSPNNSEFVTPEKFPQDSQVLEKLNSIYEALDFMPNPYGEVGKMASKAFVGSAAMTVQGADDIRKIDLNEPSAIIQVPAGLAKTAFGAAGTVLPSLIAFNTSIEGLKEVFPEEYIGAVMAPLSTMVSNGVFVIPIPGSPPTIIPVKPTKGVVAAAELGDIIYQALLAKGFHDLAFKVKENQPLSPLERNDMAKIIDEAIVEYKQPFSAETLAKIPPELAPEKKIEVAPLVEEKTTLEIQKTELESSKEKVDDSFHKGIDEEIKKVDEDIEAKKNEINEKIKSSGLQVRSAKLKTQPSEELTFDERRKQVNEELGETLKQIDPKAIRNEKGEFNTEDRKLNRLIEIYDDYNAKLKDIDKEELSSRQKVTEDASTIREDQGQMRTERGQPEILQDASGENLQRSVTEEQPVVTEVKQQPQEKVVPASKSILNQKTDLNGGKKEAWMYKNALSKINAGDINESGHNNTLSVAIENVRRGDKSKTPEAPLVEIDENGNATIIDGHHRIAENILNGDKIIEAVVDNKFNIRDAIRDGKYQQAISDGRLTASDAKAIIESSGLKVPKDILELAKKEQDNQPKTTTKESVKEEVVESLKDVDRTLENKIADIERRKLEEKIPLIKEARETPDSNRERDIYVKLEDIDTKYDVELKTVKEKAEKKEEVISPKIKANEQEKNQNDLPKEAEGELPQDKPNIQTAKQRLAEARKKVTDAYRSPGIDPFEVKKKQAQADRELLDAYVGLAKEYIKEGVKDATEFAKQLGEDVSDNIRNAWDIATGKKEDVPIEPRLTDKERERSMVARLMKSEVLSEEQKAQFEKNIKTPIQNQEASRRVAKEIINNEGVDKALDEAIKGTFDDDLNSSIIAQSVDHFYEMEQRAATVAEKNFAAERWAETYLKYQELAEAKGRFNSQIKNFYKHSPLGLRLAAERANTEYVNERMKPIEGDVKAALDDLMATIEGAVTEEIKTGIKDATIKEKAKKIADKIRTFKSKPLELKDENGNPIIIEKKGIDLNDVIESIAVAVEKTGELAQAISSELGKLKWYNDLTDSGKDAVRKQLADHLSEAVPKEPKKKITETEQEKILKKWRTKLNRLTEKQRLRLIQKAGAEMIGKGALEYSDFRQMYAEVAGLDQLTPAVKIKLEGLAKDINAADAAMTEFMDATDANFPQAQKNLNEAQIKARRASKEYQDFFRKDKNPIDTFINVARLNTLPLLSIVTNVAQYPFYQPLRFMDTLIGTPIDLALTKLNTVANMGFEKVGINFRLPTERTTSLFSRQLGAYSGLKHGISEGLQDVRRGNTDRDYFKKEIRTSIKPLRAWAEMISALKGEQKLSFNSWANNIIEGTGGIPAEVWVRMMNLFDKPLRYSAEQAKARELGLRLGKTGIELQKFITNPPDAYIEQIRSAGERSVFQQKNIVNEAIQSGLKKLDKAETPTGKIAAKGGKLLFYGSQPFTQTPLNMFNTVVDYAIPELSLAKGVNELRLGNKERAVNLMSRAALGFGIRAFAGTLAMNGIISGTVTDSEKEREFKESTTGLGKFNQSAFNRWMAGGSPKAQQGDVVFDMQRIGIIGSLLMMHGDSHRNMTPEEWAGMTYVDKRLSEARPMLAEGLQSGVFRGTSALATALQNGSVNGVAPQILGLYTNALYPATARDIVRSTQESIYRTRVKDDAFESIRNDLRTKFPILSDMNKIPKKVNLWGDVMPATPEGANPVAFYLFDITKKQDLSAPQMGWELLDLYQKKAGDNENQARILPPNILYKFKYNKVQYDVKGKDQELLEIAIGQNRKGLVEALIDGGTIEITDRNGDEKKLLWESMNNSEKITALEKVYNEGRETGIIEYLSKKGIYTTDEPVIEEAEED